MLVFLSMALVTSCEKEKKTSNPETLNNTTWGYSGVQSGNDITATLKFEKTSFSMTITFTAEDGDAETIVERGSYAYTDPVVTLTLDEVVTGIVEGDKMAFDDEDLSAVFTRQ